MILIDTEMPEKCGLCPLFHAEYPMYCQGVKADRKKKIVAPYGQPRPDWCPLHEVYDMPTVYAERISDKDIIYREDATRYFIGLQALDKITNDNYDGKITFGEVISRLGVIPSAYLIYADSDIQKMQDLEQAQLDKAYELGKAEAESN